MVKPRIQFIILCRVSDKKQENNHSREAQEKRCREYAASVEGDVVRVYEFQESARKASKAKKMLEVVEECRRTGHTLLVSNLTRLSRDAPFLMALRDTGVKFTCADQPLLTNLTIGLYASIAQHESDQISERTKMGMEVARSKGKTFGSLRPGFDRIRKSESYIKANRAALQRGSDTSAENAAEKYRQWAVSIQDHVVAAIIKGATLSGAAAHLKELGIPTYKGHTNWHAVYVTRVLEATVPSMLEMAKQNYHKQLRALAKVV